MHPLRDSLRSSQDLRIADKRNAEVKAKYDVVANILDASCEKVNALLCSICALCVGDEEGQVRMDNNEDSCEQDINASILFCSPHCACNHMVVTSLLHSSVRSLYIRHQLTQPPLRLASLAE